MTARTTECPVGRRAYGTPESECQGPGTYYCDAELWGSACRRWFAERCRTTDLPYPGDIKGLRETLCRAQAAAGNRGYDLHAVTRDIKALQHLIDAIDVHRPLGPDGKHGDLHTPTCGCES